MQEIERFLLLSCLCVDRRQIIGGGQQAFIFARYLEGVIRMSRGSGENSGKDEVVGIVWSEL